MRGLQSLRALGGAGMKGIGGPGIGSLGGVNDVGAKSLGVLGVGGSQGLGGAVIKGLGSQLSTLSPPYLGGSGMQSLGAQLGSSGAQGSGRVAHWGSPAAITPSRGQVTKQDLALSEMSAITKKNAAQVCVFMK